MNDTNRAEIKAQDTEFEERVIIDVKSEGNSHQITQADGLSFMFAASAGVVPQVGQTARFYGKGFGFTVRGLDIDGQEMFYKTPDEHEEEQFDRLAEHKRKERAEEERSRAEYAARLAADPLAFDWDRQGPSPEAAAALDRTTDEAEFPKTYSGQSWQYAFRLWQATAANPDLLDGLGPYEEVPGILKDELYLGLTGFMEGWARNAVRQMRGKMPKPNSAVLSFGDVEQDPLPSRRSASGDFQSVMGSGPVAVKMEDGTDD